MPKNKSTAKVPVKAPGEKSDRKLKAEVLAEIEHDPKVKVTDIGVLVKDGTLTLTGVVASHDEKWSAMESAKRVEGVHEIADNVEIQSQEFSHDGDIAAAGAKRLEEAPLLLGRSVRLMVAKGWVTLEGEVGELTQKKMAEESLRGLEGVRGVSNLISIKGTLSSEEVGIAVRTALENSPALEQEYLEIETRGSKVVLHVKVKKPTALVEAARITGLVPGVTSVENKITVKQ